MYQHRTYEVRTYVRTFVLPEAKKVKALLNGFEILYLTLFIYFKCMQSFAALQ